MKAGKQEMPSFRMARPSDIERLYALEYQEQAYPWSYEILEGTLDSGRHRVGLYEFHEEIVGYFAALSVADEYTLLNLLVSTQYRGRGFGRTMLNKLISMAKAEAETIFLEVRVSNLSAINLYLSVGFVEIGQRRGYYPAKKGREDALLMALPLIKNEKLFSGI
ncbi:MAG: ribosomal protein S18-alanine N-acetyltransferase [Pseudomonadales bacterium]|nr:ribosomal protein S18-alanine N-acetyltransferase [Pseudomonadales bacterium]